MSDAITLQFKGLSNRQKSLLVGALYRQSLVQVGKSPDYHYGGWMRISSSICRRPRLANSCAK